MKKRLIPGNCRIFFSSGKAVQLEKEVYMTYLRIQTWFFYIIIVLLFTGCSGGSSAVDLPAGGNITQGIAVDPYIEGAVFQEIDPSTGEILQIQSFPSDEFGVFTFPQPLTPGSVIEMKISNKGLHGGAPYQGMLRREVTAGDNGQVVVSPLTTLLANGIPPEDLIAVFDNAGLTGLTISDLYSDPMEGLAGMTTGVTDQDLKLLQAAMAANAYMEIIDDFHAGLNELNDYEHFEIFSSMLDTMQNLLDPVEFETIIAALSGDPDVSSSIVLEDFILAVLAQQQTIVALSKENMETAGGFSPDLVEQALADAMQNSIADVKYYYSQRVPPSTTYDGAALYADNCSSCHNTLASTRKPGRSAADIQTAINNNRGGMGVLNNLTQGEIAAIAEALQPLTPQDPNPPAPADGNALYSSNCAGCHQPLNVTSKPGRTANAIQAAIDSNLGGMGFLSGLTLEEVQAIADVLPQAPVVDPNQPPDGIALYASECAGCHQPLDVTSKPGRTAADIQDAIDGNLGGMGFLSGLTLEEIQAIADVLPQAPVVDPNQPPDGIALYASECAGCHQPLDVTTKPGRTAAAIQAAIDSNLGGMGFLGSLTVEEVQAIADALPQADNPGPDYSDCTLCHGQPPSGNSYPDTAGAHAVHTALASVGTNCSVCHLGAAHNSQVDLAFPAGFDAQSGPATDNLDGTCSSIKCHGGRTTPDWWSGSIAVDTQCSSCHSSGSSQYNSYSSGRHTKHVQSEGYSCTVCHNVSTLRNGHFSNLESSGFELSPAATIGGGATRVGSYSSGTCSSIDCHGSKSWFSN